MYNILQNPPHVSYTQVDNAIHSIELEFDHFQEFPLSLPQHSEKKATLFSCFLNLSNTILGSGILALPFAFANAGYILGIFLLVFFGFCSGFSLHLLSLAAMKSGLPATFHSVTKMSAPKLSYLVEVAVALKTFGVSISYLIVVGDLMPQVIDGFGVTSSYWVARELWITIVFFAITPVCFYHNMDSLRFTSFAAVCFVIFLTVLIVYYSVHPICKEDNSSIHPTEVTNSCYGEISLFELNTGTFKNLSIFVFAFTCQQNMFSVLNEMKSLTVPKVNIVIVCAIGISMCLYLIVSLFGYHAYGNSVESNILLSYPGKL